MLSEQLEILGALKGQFATFLLTEIFLLFGVIMAPLHVLHPTWNTHTHVQFVSKSVAE